MQTMIDNTMQTMIDRISRVTPGASFEDAVREVGIGFEVEKVPALTAVQEYDVVGDVGSETVRTRYVEAEDCFIIRRTDSNRALGHVGKRYSPVQNMDALGSIETLIEGGLAEVYSGATYGGGAMSLLTLKLDVDALRDRGAGNGLLGSEIQPYALVRLTHDGGGSNLVSPMPIRLFCSNQLPGLGGVKIRHVGRAREKTRRAAEDLFGGLASGYGAFLKDVHALKDTRLSDAAFRRIVLDGLAPLPALNGEPTARAVTMREKQEARREEITRLWTAGAGHDRDRSAWEALNGAIEAMDHSDLFDSKNRVKSSLVGTMDRKKRTTMNRLIDYVRKPNVRAHYDASLN